MAASPEQNSQTPDDFERRCQIWRMLIAEGTLVDKPPQELTESDLDQIDLRLSLENYAAGEGIGVEQLFEEWQDDSKFTIGPFSAEEMIAYLHRAVEDESDQQFDDASSSDHAGDAD